MLEENGRTYHTYKDGSMYFFVSLKAYFDLQSLTKNLTEYMLPNDEVRLLLTDSLQIGKRLISRKE